MDIFRFPQVHDNTCPEIWQRMFIAQNNETFVVKPCCYAAPRDTNQVAIRDPKKIFHIYNTSSVVTTMREENLQGRLDSGCVVCAAAESSTGSSGRTRALEHMKDNTVVIGSHVDLNLGNLCNLACAICDPHSSTSWLPLYNKMNDRPWQDSNPYKVHDRPVIDDPEWFKNIKVLQLQGGEVFLQPAYVDFFQNLERHRDLSEITVRVFTNGTVIPSPDLIDMFRRCQQVDIWFSIDDIGQRFEYQRRGARWTAVLENLNWFRNNRHAQWNLGFHPTYSLLNIYYLPELMRFLSKEFPDWSKIFGPYHVGTGPCSADILPGHIRQAILDKSQTLPELDWVKDFIQVGDRDFGPFFDYLARYDRATNASYSAAHAEFWQLIKS